MFNGCNEIIEIKFKNFITNKVTDMRFMFNNCSNLITLDVSNFNTDNVSSSQNIFFNCPAFDNIKHLKNLKILI